MGRYHSKNILAMFYKIIYQKNGKLKEEKIEIQNIKELEKYKNIIEVHRLDKKRKFKKSKLEDYQLFFDEFTMLLESNLSLSDTIELLKNNNYSSGVSSIIECFDKALQNGTSIYEQLLQYDHFPSEVYFFINNSEKSGDFYHNISALAQIFAYKKSIKDKLIKLLWYPAFLMIALIIALGFMMFIILPEFEYIFVQFNGNLPLATQILLDVKNVLESYYHLVFVFLLCICLLFYYLKSKYKYHFDTLVYLHLPIISKLYQNYLQYQLFLLVSISLQSNNKISETFIFIENSFTNLYFNEKINSIIELINSGSLFHEAFIKQNIFDDWVLRLIYVADNTNNYTKSFTSLSHITLSKIDKNINLLSKISEPLLLLVIGLFLLLVVLGVMSPVWEFSNIE